jgi:hypothetical protein
MVHSIPDCGLSNRLGSAVPITTGFTPLRYGAGPPTIFGGRGLGVGGTNSFRFAVQGICEGKSEFSEDKPEA